MKPAHWIVSLALFLLILPCCAAEPSTRQVNISFTFNRQSGMSTNQFVVWVENDSGKIINTIYITSFQTAMSGWQIRDDNLILWTERSGVQQMPRNVYDAFTGATPSASQLMEYTWKCDDYDGKPVEPGLYHIFVEGSMSSDSHVLFTIPLVIGEWGVEQEAGPDFFGGGTRGRDMIESVKVVYRP